MNDLTSLRAALAALLAVACSGLAAQTPGKSDLGEREYRSNCAACHGAGGKGDGPYNELLKRRAADLTTLSKRNGGVFPVSRVYEVIDGAGDAHGTREMPIFGSDYKIQAAEHYGELTYDPEAYTRGRILALIEYLNRIQVR